MSQAVKDANRVRWHSRRGMLELDVLLLPFSEQAYDSLNETDKELYRRLLAYEDPDLFGWFMEHRVSDDAEIMRMVQMVLDFGQTQNRLK